MRSTSRHHRLGILGRILLLNLLIVFLPVAAMLLLDTYEEQLLDSLERGLVQQGRMLAASLSLQPEVTDEHAARLIAALDGRHESRIRVLDTEGRLLADSATIRKGSQKKIDASSAGDSRLADSVSGSAAPDSTDPSSRRSGEDPRESLLYRIASFPVRTARRVLGNPDPVLPSADFYTTSEYANGVEVQAALSGRYGAATRVSAGGQISVTLYSALPISPATFPSGSEVAPADAASSVSGVVLVSQSTFRILQDIYQVRLDVFRIFLWCLAVAIVVSIFLALTIARPLRVLETRAREAVDERGRLRGPLPKAMRSDEIGALSHSLSDLTEQMHHYTRRIEGFAADASHELKNPLASIAASCEIAATTRDEARRTQMLARARMDVKRAEAILGGMRELSHIDAGEPSGFCFLESTLGAAHEELATRCTEHHLVLDLQQPSEPQRRETVVGISEERLYQVVSNLVENSSTIAPGGTTITISARTTGPDVQSSLVTLSVDDEGPGIEEPERIFDRFYSAREEKGDHLGLGLSVVKAIVEAGGGRVSARNHETGAGAQVIVRLPRRNQA